MIAIIATMIILFALAENHAATQKGRAFQASSPKNFTGHPSGWPFFYASWRNLTRDSFQREQFLTSPQIRPRAAASHLAELIGAFDGARDR